MNLSVVICTHNRLTLLIQAIASLNRATHPNGVAIKLLIIVNACTDGTVEWLRSYQQLMNSEKLLPLQWSVEKTPGKSNALNRAIGMIKSPVTCFIDDDQRVHHDYFCSVVKGINQFPDFDLFCGRMKPDWTGKEPNWVHDKGPYRIRLSLVPEYDLGSSSIPIIQGTHKLPSGGNIIVKSYVFKKIKGFSTDIGPKGHNLIGGEDMEFLSRALKSNFNIRYLPELSQYHYVDPERLRLLYILKKSFQRTRSSSKIMENQFGLPSYLIYKVCIFFFRATLSFNELKARYFLVRLAAVLGEIQNLRDNNFIAMNHSVRPKPL